jgi:hypothetical protein
VICFAIKVSGFPETFDDQILPGTHFQLRIYDLRIVKKDILACTATVAVAITVNVFILKSLYIF